MHSDSDDSHEPRKSRRRASSPYDEKKLWGLKDKQWFGSRRKRYGIMLVLGLLLLGIIVGLAVGLALGLNKRYVSSFLFVSLHALLGYFQIANT